MLQKNARYAKIKKKFFKDVRGASGAFCYKKGGVIYENYTLCDYPIF